MRHAAVWRRFQCGHDDVGCGAYALGREKELTGRMWECSAAVRRGCPICTGGGGGWLRTPI